MHQLPRGVAVGLAAQGFQSLLGGRQAGRRVLRMPHHVEVAQMAKHVPHELVEVRAVLRQSLHEQQSFFGVALRHDVHQLEEQILLGHAQQRQCILQGDGALAVRSKLIQRADGVAEASRR